MGTIRSYPTNPSHSGQFLRPQLPIVISKSKEPHLHPPSRPQSTGSNHRTPSRSTITQLSRPSKRPREKQEMPSFFEISKLGRYPTTQSKLPPQTPKSRPPLIFRSNDTPKRPFTESNIMESHTISKRPRVDSGSTQKTLQSVQNSTNVPQDSTVRIKMEPKSQSFNPPTTQNTPKSKHTGPFIMIDDSSDEEELPKICPPTPRKNTLNRVDRFQKQNESEQLRRSRLSRTHIDLTVSSQSSQASVMPISSASKSTPVVENLDRPDQRKLQLSREGTQDNENEWPKPIGAASDPQVGVEVAVISKKLSSSSNTQPVISGKPSMSSSAALSFGIKPTASTKTIEDQISVSTIRENEHSAVTTKSDSTEISTKSKQDVENKSKPNGLQAVVPTTKPAEFQIRNESDKHTSTDANGTKKTFEFKSKTESQGKLEQSLIADRFEKTAADKATVSEDPNKIPDEPVVPDSNSTSEVEQQKLRRMKAMAERNERNRQIEDREEDESEGETPLNQSGTLMGSTAISNPLLSKKTYSHYETTEKQSPSHLPAPFSGPVSLKSQGGKANLVRKKSKAPEQQPSDRKPKSREEKIGEILPQDIWLISWRDEGNQWPIIRTAFERATGISKSIKMLQGRYKALKPILEESDANQDLLNHVSDGDETARLKLNKMVHGEWPPPGVLPGAPSKFSGINVPGIGAPGSEDNDIGKAGHSKVRGEDISLLRWRDSGMKWPEIVEKYESLTGQKLHYGKLRDRYLQVQSLIRDLEGVDSSFLARSARGDQESLDDLNKAIQGICAIPKSKPLLNDLHDRDWSPSASCTPSIPPEDFQSNRTATNGYTPGFTNFKPPEAIRSYSSNSGGSARPLGPRSENTPVSSTFEDSVAPHERPTTGGKTLNEKSFMHLLEAQAEAYAEIDVSSNDEEFGEREGSPVTPEDACHFVYNILRREIFFEDAEEGADDISDVPWTYCGREFEILASANAYAAQQALRAKKGGPVIADPNRRFSMISEKDEDGRLLVTVSSELGVIEVKVAQTMRAFYENIAPTSKTGWAPRTVWFVKQRTVTKTGGDNGLFEMPSTTTLEENLEDTVYTTLQQANERAVEHMVNLTFESETINLKVRAAEREDFKRSLIAELDNAGDEVLFKKMAEGEDGTSVEVLVEPGRLAGPRNL